MASPCPGCGCLSEGANCPLCGVPMDGTAVASLSDAPSALSANSAPTVRRGVRVPVGWVHLAVGGVVALLLTVVPAFRFLGWLIGSLFHETGHVAFAWFVGCPAWPAIDLRGHAVAIHQPQSTGVLVLLAGVFAAGLTLAWRTRWRVPLLVLIGLWPIFAFLPTLRELGFLLSGHLGELTFAGVFLWRARTGEAIEQEAERPLYAGLGWFLIARNVILGFGLAFVPAVRRWYLGNGSFGLRNDYARVADDILHVSLGSVGFAMALVAVAVAPLVLWLARPRPVPFAPPPAASQEAWRRERVGV